MEQRYQAVLAVIAEGVELTEAASRFGVSRQTLRRWLARCERAGLAGLADRSHVLRGCPHRMDPAVEVVVLEMRDVILLRLPTRLVTRKLQALSCSAQMQPTTHSDHASNVP